MQWSATSAVKTILLRYAFPILRALQIKLFCAVNLMPSSWHSKYSRFDVIMRLEFIARTDSRLRFPEIAQYFKLNHREMHTERDYFFPRGNIYNCIIHKLRINDGFVPWHSLLSSKQWRGPNWRFPWRLLAYDFFYSGNFCSWMRCYVM